MIIILMLSMDFTTKNVINFDLDGDNKQEKIIIVSNVFTTEKS